MSSVFCVDLLNVINNFTNRKLEKVSLYGKIEYTIPQPTQICDKWRSGGVCASFLIYLVDLGSYTTELQQAGVYNQMGKYMVNGSVGIYVPEELYKTSVNKFFKVDCTLRTQPTADKTWVSAYQYEVVNGKWGITYNRISEYNPYVLADTPLGFIFQGNGLPKDIENYTHFHAELTDTTISTLTNFGKKNEPLERDKIIDYTTTTDKPQTLDLHDRAEVLRDEALLSEMHSSVKACEDKLTDFARQLKEHYHVDYKEDDEVIKILEACNRNKKSVPINSAHTGEGLLKNYMKLHQYIAKQKYNGVRIDTYIVNFLDDVIAYLTDNTNMIQGTSVQSLIDKAFGEPYSIYAGFVEAISGVKLKDCATELYMQGISLKKILENNPYNLYLLGYITFNDALTLSELFGNSNQASVVSSRNICCVLDCMNEKGGNSTAYTFDSIRREKPAIFINKDKYTGKMYRTRVSDMKLYLGVDSQTSDIQGEFSTYGNYYIKNITSKELQEALGVLQQVGLLSAFKGKEGTNYITSNNLNQEFIIYDILTEKQENDYSSEDIDTYIREYEEEAGFTLEEKQKKAIHLLEKGIGVISGPAGSGKTTAVDALVYVLRKLNPDVNIQFATPTGKAAKVLQGVVHEEVKTLHSLCRLDFTKHIGQEDEFGTNNLEFDEDTVYIIDETSMITANLLSRVLCKTLSNKVFFIGDIYQLPSIGKGAVLRDLLSYLPCVYLTVTKRSAENSGITYNSNIINNFSDKSNWQPLQDREDFIRISCKDEEIASEAQAICSTLLRDGVKAEDIQVISPLNKRKYKWGSEYLNTELKPLFNKYPTETVQLGNDKYISIGDRVIHTKKNMYDMQWYKMYNGCDFEKINAVGISNGEVGKVVGFVSSEDANFLEFKLDEGEFNNTLDARNDANYSGLFIVVEYKNYMTDGTFCILYRAKELPNKDVRTLIGEDTGYLDLFYCGSVHKMQGSQARYIIGCIGSDLNYDFINRNMLYTLVTRASDRVYLIGSVDEVEQSQLTKGRKITEANTTRTYISQNIAKDGKDG